MESRPLDQRIAKLLDEQRINALRKYEILDSPPEDAFDRITLAACKIFDMPVSTVSLVDSNRIWFKSKQGLPVFEIDLCPGLCASVTLNQEFYEIIDAEHDPRTKENPLVYGDLALRYYAGYPLVTKEGYSLGSFCIIDMKPRPALSPNQVIILKNLAEMVMDMIEMRLSAIQAVRVRNDLMTFVANDIREPLNNIALKAKDIMNDDNAREISRIRAEDITKSATRINNLLDDVTVSSHLDKGVIKLNTSTFNLSLKIQELAARLQMTLKNKRQVLIQDIPQICLVHADRNYLILIMENLLTNAIKFSPISSTILITLAIGKEMHTLCIKDQGPGFQPEELPRLFMRFGRLSAKPTAGEASSGLGLSIAHMLAVLHGGTLEGGNRTDGSGAEFTLKLPAHLPMVNN